MAGRDEWLIHFSVIEYRLFICSNSRNDDFHRFFTQKYTSDLPFFPLTFAFAQNLLKFSYIVLINIFSMLEAFFFQFYICITFSQSPKKSVF